MKWRDEELCRTKKHFSANKARLEAILNRKDAMMASLDTRMMMNEL